MSQQTGKIRKQPENWENRNGPDLVQAFPKKWWVESDFTAPYLPLPLRLKGSGRHYNSIFNNTVLKNIIHLGQRPPKFRGPIGKSGAGFIYYIAFRHCLNISENNTPPTVLTISLLYYIQSKIHTILYPQMGKKMTRGWVYGRGLDCHRKKRHNEQGR